MNKRTQKQERLIFIANQAVKDGKTVLYVSFGRKKKPQSLSQSVRYQLVEPRRRRSQ